MLACFAEDLSTSPLLGSDNVAKRGKYSSTTSLLPVGIVVLIGGKLDQTPDITDNLEF